MSRHAGAELTRIESAGYEQNRVANRLRLQSPHTHPVQQLIRRIGGGQQLRVDIRIGHTRLAIRLGKNDLANRSFQGPTMVDQVMRQPIEQLLMAGGRALQAEVVGAGYDAATEVMLPQPVDQNPCGQRVVGRGSTGGGRDLSQSDPDEPNSGD